MTLSTNRKITIFIGAVAVLFAVLIARLYFLQIIEGDVFTQRSESNFIQERVIKHSRGSIIDTEGVVLADNRLAYDVYITFAMLPNSFKNLRELTSSLNISRKELSTIDHEIMRLAKDNTDKKVVLKKDVALKDCLNILETARVKMITGLEVEKKSTAGQEYCDISIASLNFPSSQITFNELQYYLGSNRSNLDELWQKVQKKSQGLGRFKPHLLVADIGFDAYSRLENAISLGKLSGINVVSSQRRRYGHKELATHLVGILNQVSLTDIKDNQSKYRVGDFIGRNGIEKSFENVLRGQDGIERVVVDAKGRRFSDAKEDVLLGKDRIIAPSNGATVRLSIDSHLQQVAEKSFLGLAGSIVVMEVDTGYILALASFPNFDPNVLVSADNTKYFKDLLADKLRPLRNKAVQDHYMPGSIFKSMTALAGLSRKLITPTSIHNCNGVYQIHKTQWRCFKREGHGPINMVEALKVSCDSYFYELGHRMGLDVLSEVAGRLGFGSRTEIDLVGETPGILPSRDYYKKRLGYVAPGFVVNFSIGQGDLSVSPVQMASAYVAMANGGTVYKPQLVKEIVDEQGKVIKQFTPMVKSTVADSAHNFKEILDGLSYVTEPKGSAYSIRYNPQHAELAKWLKDNNVTIVGKTGTAQVVKLSKQVKHVDPLSVPYEHRDHAWFVSVYPHKAPKIAVVVMTEHASGTGGAISAPVAIKIIKAWHEKYQSLLATGHET